MSSVVSRFTGLDSEISAVTALTTILPSRLKHQSLTWNPTPIVFYHGKWMTGCYISCTQLVGPFPITTSRDSIFFYQNLPTRLLVRFEQCFRVPSLFQSHLYPFLQVLDFTIAWSPYYLATSFYHLVQSGKTFQQMTWRKGKWFQLHKTFLYTPPVHKLKKSWYKAWT